MEINIKDIQKSKELKKCIFCNKKNEKGIIILDNLICNKCNRTMIDLNPKDMTYKFYKKKIKSNIVRKFEIY